MIAPTALQSKFTQTPVTTLGLPFLVTVKQVTDRGFGFANCDAFAGDLFFHVTAQVGGQADLADLRTGSHLMCQLGTRAQDPHRLCIVQWMPYLPIRGEKAAGNLNQELINSVRAQALAGLGMEDLCHVLKANWYQRTWVGNVPKDLKDPVLAVEVLTRLAAIEEGDPLKFEFLKEIKNSPFTFSSCFQPDQPDFALLQMLPDLSLGQLAELGAPQIEWLSEIHAKVEAFLPLPSPTRIFKRKLSDLERSQVIDWYLLHSRQNREADLEWLRAKDPAEALSAHRILEHLTPLPDRYTDWLLALARKGWLDQDDIIRLTVSSTTAAAALFTQLEVTQQKILIEAWANDPVKLTEVLKINPEVASTVAKHKALAVDLETDGEVIREIGCAVHSHSECLFHDDDGPALATAFRDLSDRILSSTILVGHNILAWDWPIITSHVPDLKTPLIWDTQYVQYLIDPAAPSHALGGNHTAQFDAVAAFDLFSEQLAAMPATVAARLVTGQFPDTLTLLRDIVNALADAQENVARPEPDWMQEIGDSGLVLAPKEQLRALDWIPNIALIEADTNTPLLLEFHEIDLERLNGELTPEFRASPIVVLLSGVIKRAKKENVAIRHGMVPLWLRRSSVELENALARSVFIPSGDGLIKIAPLPQSADWWLSHSSESVRCLLPKCDALILSRRIGLDELRSDTPLKRRAILRFLCNGSVGFWTYPDQPARRLSEKGGWRNFETLRLPKKIALLPNKKASGQREHVRRPVLIRRERISLFPGTQGQFGYWRSVFRDFQAIDARGKVKLLLLGSTESPEMLSLLRDVSVELGISERKAAHHSRREHLLRAQGRGFVIIDKIENWSEWQALGKDAGVAILPIIEAVPLEEWFACDHVENTVDDNDGGGGQQVHGFTEADLLKRLPDLVERFMGPWIDKLGFENERPILLDGRLEAVAYEIGKHVAFENLEELILSEDKEKTLQICLAPFSIGREEAPSDFASMEEFLIEHWQPNSDHGNRVTGFKPTQTAAIHAIAGRGQDVMVALPTGEGKSVLFQVPALCRGLSNRKLTLVLSPLKALMRDQVVRLHDQGFCESVDHINSDRPSFEIDEVMQGLLDNRIVMLYVAPERLRNARFMGALSERIENDGGLEYVVFDEAHCVNQWGYDFRPDYFHAFKQLLKGLRCGEYDNVTPFLLLSATLTASDRDKLSLILDKGSAGGGKLPLQICPDPDRIDNPLREHIQIDPVAVRGDLLVRDGYETALAERLPHLLDAVNSLRSNMARTGQRSAVLIFVTRRAHADALAYQLSQTLEIEVESFHAGLDAATREDIYHRFKDGNLDCLVATKAFGMGMDIPDIHRVVHLSSPFYLEDYLQEVGRIGRGLKEYKNTGLNILQANILCSSLDFERMRGLRAANNLQASDISKIELAIDDIANVINGKSVALVPQFGFAPYETPAKQRAEGTKMALCLFWLEEAGHLYQVGKIADTVAAELDLGQLATIARENSHTARIAEIILKGLRNGSEPTPPSPKIVQNIDFLEGFRKASVKKIGAGDTGNSIQVILNMAQIRREAHLPDLDQVMARLTILQNRGALKLIWVLEFAKRKLLEENTADIVDLIYAVTVSARSVLQNVSETGRWLYVPEDIFRSGDWRPLKAEAVKFDNRQEQNRLEARRKRFVRAWHNGLRSLLRNSDVRLREIKQAPQGKLLTEAVLPKEKFANALARCNLILKLAPVVLDLVLQAIERNQTAIDVYNLVAAIQSAHPKGDFTRQDLFAVLRFLSSLNLISAQPELTPLSYVVVLTGHDAGFEQHSDLMAQLAEVNELAGLRGDAMEIFTHLPVVSHGEFITQYFRQKNVAEMKAYLAETLEQHESDGDNFFSRKLDALRATKISEFFERYRSSQEPMQWQAICHPYDKHLLVNAGPGAGKTSVLVGRITHLIREQQLKPAEIVILAFNRAVVAEIRQRLRELFRSLGLGSYVERLRVSTFHGLAARHLELNRHKAEDAYNDMLSHFAAKLKADVSFREKVSGDCRAILIDEFQDMSEDVWSIIQSVHEGSGKRAGVMAIGDDDQDILRWQRKTAPFFAEGYFELFRKRFGPENLTELELQVNFRSGTEIVTRSQDMIAKIFERNQASRRLKNLRLRAADGAQAAQVERWSVVTTEPIEAENQLNWDQMLLQVAAHCREHQVAELGTLAILCRENRDVAALHQYLSQDISDLTVQGSINLRIASMRHIALWLDFIDSQISADDLPLNNSTRSSLISAFTEVAICPSSELGDEAGVAIGKLWELCVAESSLPHLSDLAEFIRGLQLDEYVRLTGGRRTNGLIVLSTIHKVKGLEFDTVIVLPSRASFGMKFDSPKRQLERDEDAAEETRLYYVALTRAKKKLIYYMGPRENAWGRPSRKAISGYKSNRRVLAGSADEVFISWSMESSSFHADADETQAYIEKHVQLGDRVSLGGRGAGAFRGLLHEDATGKSRQIGFLADKVGAGNTQSDLKVSAVVRYSSDNADGSTLCNRVSGQGWGYVVLVSGRLR